MKDYLRVLNRTEMEQCLSSDSCGQPSQSSLVSACPYLPPLPSLSIQAGNCEDVFSNGRFVQSQTSVNAKQERAPSVESETANGTSKEAVILSDNTVSDSDGVCKLAPIFLKQSKPKEVVSAKVKRVTKRKSGPPAKRATVDLTAWKLSGSSEQEDVVTLLTNAKDVISYSPRSKSKRSKSPLRPALKRSRSPSPSSPQSSPKKSILTNSNLIVSHSNAESPVAKFTATRSAAAVQCDFAPFQNLVHVDQVSDEWYKSVKSGTLLRKRLDLEPITLAPTFQGTFQSLLSTEQHKLRSKAKALNPVQVSDVLNVLKGNHPKVDVSEIFQRISSAAGGLGLLEPIQPALEGGIAELEPKGNSGHLRKKRKSSSSTRGDPLLALKCSIPIKRTAKKRSKEERILVNEKRIFDLQCRSHSSASSGQNEPIDLCSPKGPRSTSSKIPHFGNAACKQSGLGKPTCLDLWTDVTAPHTSAQVLGNGYAVTAIMSWLKEWKERMQGPSLSREPNKKPAGRGRGTSAADDRQTSRQPTKVSLLDSSDSDFESPVTLRAIARRRAANDDDDWICDDSEEDDDEEGPCKAMLISGPTGCGKTAAVYTCARELGFNVIEMNASSLRSRHQVISRLMEASQSHQVSRSKGGLEGYFSTKQKDITDSVKSKREESSGGKGRKKNTVSGKKEPKKSDLPKSSLKSFFKPNNPKLSENNPSSASTLPITSSSSSKQEGAGGLNKASVILLEDVDILFEDYDKGFWSAVYEVLSASRKPIVFTCADPSLELTCGYLNVVFSSPPLDDISTYLQVLSLTRGMKIEPEESNLFIKLLNMDIRKCLLAMQLWLGGTKERAVDTLENSTHVVEERLSQYPFLSRVVNTELTLEPTAVFPSQDSHASLKDHGLSLTYALYRTHLKSLNQFNQTSLCDQPKAVQDRTVLKQLKAVHEFANSMSELDVVCSTCAEYEPAHITPWWKASSSTSLVDEQSEEDIPPKSISELSEMSSFCEALALRGLEENVRLPSPDSCLSSPFEAISATVDSVHETERILTRQSQLWSAASPLLGPSYNLSHRDCVLDVLPTITNICTSQRLSKEAKVKRRFSHYFHYTPVDTSVLGSAISHLSVNANQK